MNLLVGMENNLEGRSLAWALEYPGCFTYGAGPDTALQAIPAAFLDYRHWVAAHSPAERWPPVNPGEPCIIESWDVYSIDAELVVDPKGDYEVNAWFKHDWQPLGAGDLRRALLLLDWSRRDLMEAVAGLDTAALQANRPGERWSILGILKHVSAAEGWYLDCLELAFRPGKMVDDPFERLNLVRLRLLQVLPTLVSSRRVLGKHGEFWSPRKLVRRALWHERDHTSHILRLR